MKNYFHKNQSLEKIDLPVGKIVCVGRNYAQHAIELGNEVPSEPLFFMKPKTALVDLQQAFHIPKDRGSVHFETEIAVLLQADLKQASIHEVEQAIWGYGIAFDLTLRDLQNTLKEKGHPWEKAKAFDGAAPVSCFITKQQFSTQHLIASTTINNKLVQVANTQHMLWSIPDLLLEMSQHFLLEAGDIILTGTPEGVGPLHSGDLLDFKFGEAEEAEKLAFSSSVS